MDFVVDCYDANKLPRTEAYELASHQIGRMLNGLIQSLNRKLNPR